MLIVSAAMTATFLTHVGRFLPGCGQFSPYHRQCVTELLRDRIAIDCGLLGQFHGAVHLILNLGCRGAEEGGVVSCDRSDFGDGSGIRCCSSLSA